MSGDQMSEAMRRQREHVNASLSVDRRGWTRAQWVEDARRLMGDVDGSVLDLVNGHVLALLRDRAAMGEVVDAAREVGPPECDVCFEDECTGNGGHCPCGERCHNEQTAARMGLRDALVRLDGDAS